MSAIGGCSWVVVGRPGYFGSRRDAQAKDYDERYGAGNWRIAWSVDGRIVDRREALALYEDAYYEHLRAHPERVDQLCRDASDVYDDALTNLQSGTDYDAQETDRNHVQDIAIRRALLRLGRRFDGSRPVQIRHTQGTHPLSRPLSPGAVPFHHPELIVQPELERWWWEKGSVEAWYQSGKVLVVGRDSLDR